MNLLRDVRPEWLDSLDPEDLRAIRSRQDLRRLNRCFLTNRLLGHPLATILKERQCARIVDLGAGDGDVLLGLARRHARAWSHIDLELLDLQPVIDERKLAICRALGFRVIVTRADVFDWVARPTPDSASIIVANLFLHHFDTDRLRELLQAIAKRASAFVCCEPRRSRFALACSGLLGIACNDVTLHDARVSVRAGFRGRELSALWPQDDGWSIDERAMGPFTHRFRAVRRNPR